MVETALHSAGMAFAKKGLLTQFIKQMRTLLYIIAIILVIGWLLGVFVYSLGQLIHVLLVLALVALLLGVIRRA